MDLSTRGSTGFAEENFSWQEYADTRPAYPESLLQLVYGFHSNRGSESWDLAADVGAGHGVLAGKLARQFRKVAVLEPNPEYLEVARQQLSQLERSEAVFSFHEAGAEEKVLDEGSVDLVMLGMCIQWTDHRQSVAAAAHHLAPGGTLAVIFYRRPYLIRNARAAEIWDEMWDAAVRIMIKTGQMDDPLTERAWRLENSGLDCVAIPSPPFDRNTTRVKINAGADLPFVASKVYPMAAPSAVEVHDLVEQQNNVEDWSIKNVSAAWLIRSLHAYLAGVQLFSKAETEAYHTRLEEALKASGGVADAVHPVSIILASKQRSPGQG